MTYRRDLFESLDEEAGGTFRMGNKTMSKVKGVGNIRVQNEDGLNVVLSNVRFIPEMDRTCYNLERLRKLDTSLCLKMGDCSSKLEIKYYSVEIDTIHSTCSSGDLLLESL